jgi:hypothetical protein
MRKSFLILFYVLLSIAIHAQQINFEYGKVFSKFDYTTSTGTKAMNLQPGINNHLGGTFQINPFQNGFYFLGDLNFNKYSASGSDSIHNNVYTWDANYLGTGLGFGYEFFKSDAYFNFKNLEREQGFTLYLQAMATTEFLMQGTQQINSDIYNLKGMEQFDKPFVFTYGGLGVGYYPSKTISVFIEYMFGKSFQVFKSKIDTSEKFSIVTHTVSLGFTVNLQTHNN